MPLIDAAARPERPLLTPGQRVFGRWWKRQSPARQDRYATLGPLLSVLLFLAAIIAAFWYLRAEEFDRQTESVKRDTEIAQQQIRLRLIENQEQLMRLARELVTRPVPTPEFLAQAQNLTTERPEIVRVAWLSSDMSERARHLAQSIDMPWASDEAPRTEGDDALALERTTAPELQAASAQAFAQARTLRLPSYGLAVQDEQGTALMPLHIPLIERGRFTGSLMVMYSVESLLRHLVPSDITKRHAMSLLDAQDHVLASTVSEAASPSSAERGPIKRSSVRRSGINHEVALVPTGSGLLLRGQGFRTSIGLVGNTLFWMVTALSVLTVWMLLGTWQHMRRRLQMQEALVSETSFRRAMENSMLTGMRAMDMEGRITYVNPAFCAMTGFKDSELVGQRPPFPHWPPELHEENSRLLFQELQGKSPEGGVEVKVMRSDGSRFDARMYVSPLIDARGQQTGWMTSMTNITEAKRVRDQLSAAHERFTTVLEGLDAAVSVCSVQGGELLFANHSYRLWFGGDAAGHAQLAGDEAFMAQGQESDDSVDNLGGLPTNELTEAGSDAREVLLAGLQKWFDVRTRYLQWTDGRLAQMLIATDITARLASEQLAAQQAERAQATSRLVTMGEMASSVAHELNQPLAAISNYCNGIISRVRSGSIDRDDLIGALEKTAKQAQRAGQIIHRIRSFVKRSEPRRERTQVSTIVDDALELAGIELRRRKVAIHSYVAQRLPPLHVDPILIEQVLLNLIKNAAEAIDSAQMPAARRMIELRVVPLDAQAEANLPECLEFSVSDTGPGLKEDDRARLFEAFYSTKSEGMGIGLSLCRSIIEAHQGRIQCDNLYNQSALVGCRFSFTIPVQHAATDALPTPNLGALP